MSGYSLAAKIPTETIFSINNFLTTGGKIRELSKQSYQNIDEIDTEKHVLVDFDSTEMVFILLFFKYKIKLLIFSE